MLGHDTYYLLQSLCEKGVMLIPTCKQENRERKKRLCHLTEVTQQGRDSFSTVSEAGALIYNILGHTVKVFSRSAVLLP